MKTTAQEAEYKTINLKQSLLKKCKNVKIRSDLGDCGVYIMSNAFFRLMNHVQDELDDLLWEEMSDHVIPFFARNQFKEKLSKMSEEAQKAAQKKMQIP